LGESVKGAIHLQEATDKVSQDTLVSEEGIIAQMKKLNDEGSKERIISVSARPDQDFSR
jgi:hypothetical protein